MELNFEKKMRMIADMQDRYSKLITSNCLSPEQLGLNSTVGGTY